MAFSRNLIQYFLNKYIYIPKSDSFYESLSLTWESVIEVIVGKENIVIFINSFMRRLVEKKKLYKFIV